MSSGADSQGSCYLKRGLCSRMSVCVRQGCEAACFLEERNVCVRDQSASGDGVLGMGLLAVDLRPRVITGQRTGVCCRQGGRLWGGGKQARGVGFESVLDSLRVEEFPLCLGLSPWWWELS